jgi:hypothetical protein
LGLCGALLLSMNAGCRPENGTANMNDDLSVTTQPDLAQITYQSVTIRKLKDRVKFSGAVISPLMYVSYTDNSPNPSYCNYRIAVMQADGSPSTLKDGMSVTIGLKTNFVGDMSRIGACQDLAKQNTLVMAMDALKTGDLVEISGQLDSFGASGTRYVDVFGGKVLGMGPAPMQPTPVVVADPTMFAGKSPLPQAFVDASGALVQFQNVQVTAADTAFPFDFVVNTGTTGGANIASNYLRILVNNYMAPTKGTKYASVTGIVFGDYGGKVWVRNSGDLK